MWVNQIVFFFFFFSLLVRITLSEMYLIKYQTNPNKKWSRSVWLVLFRFWLLFLFLAASFFLQWFQDQIAFPRPLRKRVRKGSNPMWMHEFSATKNFDLKLPKQLNYPQPSWIPHTNTENRCQLDYRKRWNCIFFNGFEWG